MCSLIFFFIYDPNRKACLKKFTHLYITHSFSFCKASNKKPGEAALPENYGAQLKFRKIRVLVLGLPQELWCDVRSQFLCLSFLTVKMAIFP